MSREIAGRVSELLLVRMHGRAEAYVAASDLARSAIVDACRREATVPDLAARILTRTIYAQSAARSAPLRELVQNALDATPRGGRVDIRSSESGAAIVITDRGRGMTRSELLGELLVPFQSAKAGDLEAIGEHGIGFFSVLEVAPCLELTTTSATEGSRLVIEPIGDEPPYADFAYRLAPIAPTPGAPTGTSIRLSLARPIARAQLAADLAASVGLVDPDLLRIYVDDVLVNTARARLRCVAREPIARSPSSPNLGALELFVGAGEGIEPRLTIVQGGLLVAARIEAFPGYELALHRDLARALAAAGFGLVVELPLAVPLNKGRSGVAAGAARAVEEAITRAFERFVLEDALFDRELLRAVDHRLAGILERLVQGALSGEPPPVLPEPPHVDTNAPTVRGTADGAPAPAPTPTVAAPEEVVRFAAALLETRAFEVLVYDSRLREARHRVTLREVLGAHRGGVLRRIGDPVAPGVLYLDPRDPLADALARRLVLTPLAVTVPAEEAPPPATAPRRAPMQRQSRAALVAAAGHVPGVAALSAALAAIERIDSAIAQSAGLAPSPISVHQDLYGPDEMAHTDGTGISVNFASPRVRGLLAAMLKGDDVTAFGAVVDLIIHEKTHVSLASYVPKATAEHGASFYRRKDLLRRQLLEAMERGAIVDPIRWLPSIRKELGSFVLPDPFELASAVGSPEAA